MAWKLLVCLIMGVGSTAHAKKASQQASLSFDQIEGMMNLRNSPQPQEPSLEPADEKPTAPGQSGRPPSRKIASPAAAEKAEGSIDPTVPQKAKPPTNYEIRLDMNELKVSEGVEKKAVVKYVLARVSRLQGCFPQSIPFNIEKPVRVRVQTDAWDKISDVSLMTRLPHASEVRECLQTTLNGGAITSKKGGGARIEFELNLNK